jgi:hypothetical protein
MSHDLLSRPEVSHFSVKCMENYKGCLHHWTSRRAIDGSKSKAGMRKVGKKRAACWAVMECNKWLQEIFRKFKRV